MALRIGNLADSAMVAVHIGEVRRLVVAAPRYLKQNPRIKEPSDLVKHQIVAMAHLPNSWTFPPPAGSSVPRTVQFTPRLVINSIRGAVASAVGGAASRGCFRIRWPSMCVGASSRSCSGSMSPSRCRYIWWRRMAGFRRRGCAPSWTSRHPGFVSILIVLPKTWADSPFDRPAQELSCAARPFIPFCTALALSDSRDAPASDSPKGSRHDPPRKSPQPNRCNQPATSRFRDHVQGACRRHRALGAARHAGVRASRNSGARRLRASLSLSRCAERRRADPGAEDRQ